MEKYTGLEIAVIGLAGKFPDAGNVAQYWQNLVNAKNSINQFTEADALAEGEKEHVVNDPAYVKANGYLANKEYFDAAFFNYRPDEAELMDPQMRIFHECCWEAMEDSGYTSAAENRVGVFAAGTPNVPWVLHAEMKNRKGLVDDFTASQLRDVSFLATRISYKFNLKGPALYLQTACSSSLVAIHEACNSLLLGECSMALAGGVNINHYSKRGYLYKEGMIRSKDGKCRPFDSSSSGAVNGEGAGVVVLKRLKDAIRDRDHVYAIVKGTAVNNDGSNKVGYTAPSVKGQAEVIRKAQKMARVEPASISYIETHGTATDLGDPIEIEALNTVFAGGDANSCAVSAVKSNIGHLDSAAGVAGFIKVVLSLQHRQIPASLHFVEPNPKIDFKSGPFYVNASTKTWQNTTGPLRAGVSSFGIGGTNAHMVMEEAPEAAASSASRETQLLMLSAKTKESLERNTAQLAAHLQKNNNINLADVAYTLQTGRERFRYRKMIACSNVQEAVEKLSAGKAAEATANAQEELQHIVFMFSGQGSQYANMCADLYANEQIFRETLDECLKIAKEFSSLDFRGVLFPGAEADARINHTQYTQPLLFMVEYSLAKLLMHWGINPDYMIGHSIGEYVAACVSGVFTLNDAIRLVIRRGELMSTVESGSMLSLNIKPEELKSLINGNKYIDLSVINSESSLVVSGNDNDIDAFQQQVAAKGYAAKKLHTSHAFHSYMMESILDEFEKEFDTIEIKQPLIPYVSNVTGEMVRYEQVSKPSYWSGHLRGTVHFLSGTETLLKKGNAIFIEAGPGRTLCNYVGESKLATAGHATINTIRQAKQEANDQQYLLEKVGQLWLKGVNINWNNFYSREKRNRVSLPAYSFERIAYAANFNLDELLSNGTADKAAENKIQTYITGWKRTLLPNSSSEKKCFAVLGGNDAFSTELVNNLQSAGHTVIDRLDDHADHVIYCSLQDKPDVNYDSLNKQLWQGYLGLSQLAKAIAAGAYKQNIQVTVIANHLADVTGEDEVDPIKSALHGPARIMPSEIRNLNCKVIDIPSPYDSSKLLNEILYDTNEPFVAYRNGSRWVQSFDELPANTKISSGIRIVENGTYIITGGFGGIGFTIAKDIVHTHKANVILLHRSDFSVSQLNELKNVGCMIEAYKVDVSVEEQVEQFINEIKSRHNRISGLIWSAGEIDYGGIILNRKEEDFIKYSASKIHGLLLFEKYFDLQSLDFLAMFSSVGNVIYQVKFGQVAYNAANSFLEAYAQYANKKWGIHAFTINWCDWLDVGLTVKSVMRDENTTDIGLINSKIHKAIWPKQGLEIFHHCLQSKSTGYTIYKGSLHKDIAARQQELKAFKGEGNNVTQTENAVEAKAGAGQSLLGIYCGFFGMNDISINDDFFELGGDSLKAMSLVARINQQLGASLSIADIYKYPIIRDLQERLGRASTSTQVKFIPKASKQQFYPASSEQRRMYFLQVIDEQGVMYNETEILWATGPFDKTKVESIFATLIQRHEGLRTTFVTVDGALQQVVNQDFSFAMEYLPYQEGRLDETIASFIRPFNLHKDILLRIGIVQKNHHEHLMIIDSHHIVMDGVSRLVLRDEFNALYTGRQLPELKLQYKDYAVWQQLPAQQELIGKQREFWLHEYAEAPTPLELPTDFARPLASTHAGDFLRFDVNTADTKKLKSIAAEEGTTLFTVLLSALNILLSKAGNQEDVVIGIPVAGRPHADLESIIGMFVNTLALRNYPKAAMSLRQFIADVNARSLACYENQLYPFEELVNELKVERDSGRNPLFDLMFVYQNYEESKTTAEDFAIKPGHITHTTSRFDLTVLAVEELGQVSIRLIYSTELFKRDTAKRFVEYFQQIITSIIENADKLVGDVDILSDAEKRRLLYDLNHTQADLALNHTVIDLFMQQASKTPDAVALVHDNERITYRELDEKANAVAQIISNRANKSNRKVGLLFHHSLEMTASILGVMKAGCVYIPLSPETPDERNIYILTDCDAGLLLVQEALYLQKHLLHHNAVAIGNTIQPDHYPQQKVSPGDLAYIIYTSGTTGQPKGVEIKHGSLANYALWYISYHRLTANDVSLQLVPYHFDGFGANCYPALLSGGAMVTVPVEHKLDTHYIAELIRKEKVTNLAQTPGLYGSLLDELALNAAPEDLRFVVLAGEKASKRIVSKSAAVLPRVVLSNEYGPTEATIGATHHRPMKVEDVSVIGKPIWNTAIYILGKRMELLPTGTKGEICIAGEGIAKGYVNNPSLTAEKFMADPFVAGRTIYRTGDFGRWLSDGSIELSGREDEQLKIRGFRIEAGEIEGQLAQYETIRQAIVIAKEKDDHKFLVAYYTVDAGNTIDADALKRFLSVRLPDYMVPVYYVQMESLPYSLTGKINKKALPDPDMKAVDLNVAPVTPEEKLLVGIWSKVLGLESIGITTNFFSAGGDSIKSIQISSRLRSAGYEVPVKTIFTHPTIEQLAGKLKAAAVVTDQSAVSGYVPLTPIQRWFFSKKGTVTNHFNQAVMLNFPGGIEAGVVMTIFKKLQEHHDALRMVYLREGDEIVQENKEAGIPVSLSVQDYTPDAVAEIQSGIDLANGPLIKLGLFKMNDGCRLVIAIHHLVIDGVSWRILFEDIETLYRQIIEQQPLALPLKTDSYKLWSEKLLQYVNSNTHQQSLPYWQEVTQRSVDPIVKDNPAGRNTYADTQSISFQLSKETTALLLTQAHVPFNTQINDILLTALLLSIYKQYGNDALMLDMETHGREAIDQHINVNRTIGWFTSFYPVLLEKAGSNTAAIIQHIKETLRSVPNNGIDYLVLQYLATGSPLQNPQSQISFNYLGQFDADVSGNVFTIANESAGNDIAPATVRDYDWDFSGIITSAQLTMRLTYSTQQYNESTITNLMDTYRKSLLEVIDYCCTYGKIELSPSDLTYKQLSIAKLNELQQQYELADIYPLSPMQENMLFHSLMEVGANHYFQQMSYMVEGKLDIKAIEKSMNDLIARYDVLRTIFMHDGHERPLQIVLKERKIDFLFKDVREECLQCPEETVMLSYRSADMANSFDLRKDVLMRLTILQVSEERFLFIWSHHHIIMDGWCMSIIVSEFSKLYAANRRSANIALPSVVPYSKYIQWLEASDKQASTRYWSNYLDGYETLATLPKKEVAAIENMPYSLAWEEFSFGKEQSKKMQKFSGEQGVTLNTLLQAAWGILLAKYNNVNDVVFGSVVSGRPTEIEGIETMVGLFINTIPVRVKYAPQDTVASLLQQVQQSTMESEQYQYQSLPEIQLLNPLGRGLLDHIVVFEDYPGADKLNGEGQDYTVTGIELFEQANYDLMFIVIPGDEIRIKIDYNAHRYNKSTIQAVAKHITNILQQLTADGFATLAEIEMITAEEKEMILHSFNNSAVDYPSSKTFIDLFEEQVVSTPDIVAAIYNNQRLTYNELNAKANQLASYLEQHAERGDCIPVLMEPSIDLLVSMLGIFKAGLVYVPVNTDAPLPRIIDNIAGLDAQVLITKNEYLADETAFYEALTKQTSVIHIILCDVEQPSSTTAGLFQTYSVAAKISSDPSYALPASNELNESIGRLCSLLKNITASGQPAIFLSSPMLRIIAVQALRQLELNFHELNELDKDSLDGISVLLTEHAHNDKTDTLFWESKHIQNIILLDSYGSFSKKEDAFKQIWNHVSEETTEAINDYGWSSSYTGKSFSIEEMEEYISNFKTKLKPHLTDDSRVLEVGCGHGILLFELAPQVGYYHATDLAENILRKNKERLLRKSIYNVGLEACGASDIGSISEKDFDVVVCSSVVHYFPDTIYLEKFISNSIELMKDEGVLYLDDLMDLRQKENLIASTRQYKLEHPEAKVKTEWDNDLFVGPGFFEFLRSVHPEIVAVEITPKTGVIENELTKFRYDAMLKINKRTARMPKKKQDVKQRYLFDYISSSPIEFDNCGIINGTAALGACDVSNKQYRVTPADTCYIIYTSGTTGKPKGAMVHHAGMLNHLFAKINELVITDKDVVAETAPASFDISIWQFLAALLKGGHTYIIDREKVLEPNVLLKELQQGSVTVFESVPSLIITILDGLQKSHEGLLNKLRWMIPTGEPLSVGLARKWYTYFPAIKLLNAYGPTEASDDVTHHIVEPPAEDQLTISIGRPVQNMHIYILDKYMHLCPPGVKGEICVAGIGVGKGYWKDAEKTSKSFVPNPYKKPNDSSYDTIYKTGDVGYYQENGNIVCLGRIDNQVKIRGFRIELGEIEHWLSQYKEIQESVVIARDREGDKFLVVYYVAEHDINQPALKAFLAQKLADYMVPAYYVRLKNIPVTANGKLDRKALPDPTVTAGNGYEAPSNETEEKLAEIWSDVLKTDKSAISTSSSFFELGGHSLKATLMVNKIQKQFEVEIPLKDVFQKQTIQSLADYITTIRQMQNSIEDVHEIIEIAI